MSENEDVFVPRHVQHVTPVVRGGVTVMRDHEGGPITHIGVAINQHMFAYTPGFARALLSDLRATIDKMEKEGAGP